MSNYTIIRLGDNNIHHLSALYESVYHKKCNTKHLQLKYKTEYAGMQFLGFMAFDKNIPVAFAGLIPAMVSIGNVPVLAAQPTDVMTLKTYRGKNLYAELMQRTLELAKEKGVHFVFGFPNQNSFEVSVKKLGFSHIDTMQRFTWNFQDNVYKKIARKFLRQPKSDEKFLIRNLLLEWGHDGIIYDEKFLNYKKYNPNFFLTHNQNTFWLNRTNGLWIGSLYSGYTESFVKDINFLEVFFKQRSITYMISQGTQASAFLSGIKEPETGFPVIIKDLSEKYVFDNLKFQFADCEVF